MILHNYHYKLSLQIIITNTDYFIQQDASSPVMCAISSGLVKQNSDLTEKNCLAMWIRASSVHNINRISFPSLLLSKCSLMMAYNKDKSLLQNLLCPIYEEFHTSRTRKGQVKIYNISVTLKKVLKTEARKKSTRKVFATYILTSSFN